ncbi:MAG: hypothetical protein K5912_00565, partial [Alphaproteobacteria bacterium]|nr:hypothetical protein [Alphaproteobacteria bacterium]
MAKKIHGVINGITNDNKHYMCLVGPVDVYNLPYEEYGNNSVLTLIGDVNVSKYNPNNTPGKNPPKFSNVLVFGDFECSNQFHINIFPEKVGGKFICKNTIKKDKRLINEDTILPKSCEFIDLSYSIDSLDILIDKMPKDTRFLVVQDILIKQKSLQNNEIKLNSAKRFQERYPNIIVTNANGNIILSNVLNDIENQKQDVKQEIVIPKKKPEQKIDKVIEKSNSDLDRKDILSLCRGNDKFFDAYS